MIKKLPKTEQANYEKNIEDTLVVLPQFLTGLDINLRFNGYMLAKKNLDFPCGCISFAIFQCRSI